MVRRPLFTVLGAGLMVAAGFGLRQLATPRTVLKDASRIDETRVSIPPYLLELTPTSATVCWVTPEAVAGDLRLTSYGGTSEHREPAPVRFHTIRLEGLTPGRAHRYEVDGVHEGRFRTPAAEDVVRFAVFGHPAGTERADKYPVELLAARIDELDTDFVLCTGDICYFTSVPGIERGFFRKFKRTLAEKPIHVAPGNHEAGWPAVPGREYKDFRALFPYDYPAPIGAYHSCVHGNVKLVALSYFAVDAEDFRRQLAWLQSELETSTSEFNVVYLGGFNKSPYFDKEALSTTLAGTRVDMVFGGDGVGQSQGELGGVDYFFAGTGQRAPHPLYLVEVQAYRARVQLLDASARTIAQTWFIASRREKRVVLDLTDSASVRKNGPTVASYRDLDLPSTAFDGARFVVRGARDAKFELHALWTSHEVHEAGKLRAFRSQPLFVQPGTDNEFLVPLPTLDPITLQPWTLGDLRLRFMLDGRHEGYDPGQSIVSAAIIAD